VYDEKVTGASSFNMHNIAALTFGETQCAEVFKILKEALNVKDATPLAIEKALKLIRHLVTHGAERCVEFAWDLMDAIEPLEEVRTGGNEIFARS